MMNLLQLYGDFAEIFCLWECKLAIVHCAGHYDPTLIETLWREIINKGKNETIYFLFNQVYPWLWYVIIGFFKFFSSAYDVFPRRIHQLSDRSGHLEVGKSSENWILQLIFIVWTFRHSRTTMWSFLKLLTEQLKKNDIL